MLKTIKERNKLVEPICRKLEIKYGETHKFKEWEGFDEFSTEAVVIAYKQARTDTADKIQAWLKKELPKYMESMDDYSHTDNTAAFYAAFKKKFKQVD